MDGTADVLDWLLPEADAEEREHARRLVTFARLLHHDARGNPAGAVGLEVSGARAEMEQVDRRGLLAVFDDLLRFHLEAELPRDSWIDLGTSGRGLEESWNRIAALRTDTEDLPAVPRPGECALAVFDRILAAAKRRGAEPQWTRLWEARRVRVDAGPAAAMECWDELLLTARRSGWGYGTEARALAGAAGCRLDLGGARAAEALLVENLVLASADDELAWLAAWVALLGDNLELARELTRGRPQRIGRLPLPLVELRAAHPEWESILQGEAPEVGRAPRGGAVRSRGVFGASLLGVFGLDVDGAVRCHVLDCAPALRDRIAAGSAGRDPGEPSQMGEPGQRVLMNGETILRHAFDGRRLTGALGGAGSRAFALAPILDEEGEATGWVHVECEHHLLPARERLVAVARAWGKEGPFRAKPLHAAEAAAPPAPTPPSDDARTVFARELVSRLGMKTSRRRVFVFDAAGGELALVFETGGGLGDTHRRTGGGRALRRALRTRSPVLFGEPDAALGVHADAASGLVCPVVVRGTVHGLLAVESTRVRDFAPAGLERVAALLAREAWSWRAAQFHAWHAARFDEEVCFDPGARAWRERLADLRTAARARSSLAIVGPGGAGKEILARWVHFEGRDPDAPFHVLRSGDGEPDLPAKGTLILDELEGRGHDEQRALLERIESHSSSCLRVFALLRAPVAEAIANGALIRDLGARFERLELFVPTLRDRRDEVPGLLRALALRAARREGVGVPTFTDEAVGMVWRQDWPGNVRELDGFATRVALLGDGNEVGPGRVREVLRLMRRPLRERMPSKRPRRADLEAALESTRRANGAVNKTRAASYLGWDPDTLVARLGERGMLG